MGGRNVSNVLSVANVSKPQAKLTNYYMAVWPYGYMAIVLNC